MTKKPNLQDSFLNECRRNKVFLTIFLVNGVKLQGIVTWFDSYTVLLKREIQLQLVYKHAISTVMPHKPIDLSNTEIDPPPRGDAAAGQDEDAGGDYYEGEEGY